jgi:hypothetical protein
MTFRILLITTCLAIMVSGCGKSGKDRRAAAPVPKPETPSGARDVIEGATGYTAVQHGQKARDAVLKATATRDKDLKEFLEK